MKKKLLMVMSLCFVLLGLNASAATLTSGDTVMAVGVDDIGQLHSPNSDTLNIGGTGVTYTGTNDASTYVANDRTTQGQTFTTGADPDGYTLNGIYVKHVLYTDNMNNGTWSGLTDGTAVTVRVCSVSGTALTQLSSETATVATGSGIPGGTGSSPYWSGTGKWLYIALATPVALVANTQYSFDLTSNGPWFELAGLEAGPYAGGVAYTTATKSALDMGTVHINGDRTFALDMTPQNKLVYDAPADDFWGQNPLAVSGQVLSWTVNDAALSNIDLYIGTENEPNLITTPAYKKLSMEAVTTISYALPALENDKIYYWRVDAYEPNTLPGASGYYKYTGPVWRFSTVPANPSISAVEPAYIAVDAGEPNVVLSVTGISIDSYQWYKIGDPDVELTNGADYTGVDTDTLTILDVQLGDEGYYYCIGSNSLPASDSNRDTGPCRVMTKRLVSYYPFETTTIVDGNSVTPDIVGGFDAVLLAEGGQAAPVLADAGSLVGKYLLLDNADHATDPNGQYAQIPAGVADYGDITITVWVHPKSVAVWGRVFDFGNNTSEFMMLTTDIGSGYDPRFAITTGGVDSEQRLTPNLDSGNWIGPGAWHHVAVTLGGNTGKMFVDGVWYATNPNMTLNPVDLKTILNYIGKSQWPQDAEFNGLIDELKIYNYARTNEQIAQDYMAVTGDSYICDAENNDVWRYDQGWEVIPGDPSSWIGGNNNCKIDLPDFAGMAARWLEADQFYPAP